MHVASSCKLHHHHFYNEISHHYVRGRGRLGVVGWGEVKSNPLNAAGLIALNASADKLAKSASSIATSCLTLNAAVCTGVNDETCFPVAALPEVAFESSKPFNCAGVNAAI